MSDKPMLEEKNTVTVDVEFTVTTETRYKVRLRNVRDVETAKFVVERASSILPAEDIKQVGDPIAYAPKVTSATATPPGTKRVTT